MPTFLERELEVIRGRAQSLESEPGLPAAGKAPEVALYMAVDERLQHLGVAELASLIEDGIRHAEVIEAADATEQRRSTLRGLARLVLMELSEAASTNGNGSTRG